MVKRIEEDLYTLIGTISRLQCSGKKQAIEQYMYLFCDSCVCVGRMEIPRECVRARTRTHTQERMHLLILSKMKHQKDTTSLNISCL